MEERVREYRRPFYPERMPPEVHARYTQLIDEAMEASGEGRRERSKQRWAEAEALFDAERERYEAMFPAGPPNDACHTALLAGIRPATVGTNESGRRVEKGLGDSVTPVLQSEHERLSIWASDEGALFVVDVDPAVRRLRRWRTLANCLRIAIELASNADGPFEPLKDVGYEWIYHFDPVKDYAEQAFLEGLEGDPTMPPIEALSGGSQTLDDMAALLRVMEALYRDRVFYESAGCLLSSFDNHWFCLTCELTPPGRPRLHDNHELAKWDLAYMVPRMEVAILQAIRACEGILGEPRRKGAWRERLVEIWERRLDIDPEAEFVLAGQPHVDFYHQLFRGVRAGVAHQLREAPYEITRTLAIQAQSFAWAVVSSYFRKAAVTWADAAEKLKFNHALISAWARARLIG